MIKIKFFACQEIFIHTFFLRLYIFSYSDNLRATIRFMNGSGYFPLLHFPKIISHALLSIRFLRYFRSHMLKMLLIFRNGHVLLALRLFRACHTKMDSECLQELGHHILKAHLYKHVRMVPSDMSGKDCQLHWLNLRADDIKQSLCTERNIFLPNTKVTNRKHLPVGSKMQITV